MWWEWAFSRNFGHSVGEEEVEIMTVDWAALPNFFYLKTVIKLHWQNWPKTKHFPYLWPPAGEGDQAFLRHLSRLKTEPAAAQMSFSPASKKNPFDVSTSRHIVSASYGYGALWAHALCPTYLLYTNIFPQYSSNLTWRHMHKTILGAYVTPPTHFSGPSSSVPTPEINSFLHGVGFSFRILTKPNQVISNPIPSTFNTTMWGKKVLPK